VVDQEHQMSELAELLKSHPLPANFANPANREPEIRNFRRIRKGTNHFTLFEQRRQAVVEMLARSPAETKCCWLADDGDSEFVILSLAIRDVGTCELSIPRDRYDGFKLLELLEGSNAPA
jgi:hypothetical protein